MLVLLRLASSGAPAALSQRQDSCCCVHKLTATWQYVVTWTGMILHFCFTTTDYFDLDVSGNLTFICYFCSFNFSFVFGTGHGPPLLVVVVDFQGGGLLLVCGIFSLLFVHVVLCFC